MQSKKSGFAASVPFTLLAAWLMVFALPASAAGKTITFAGDTLRRCRAGQGRLPPQSPTPAIRMPTRSRWTGLRPRISLLPAPLLGAQRHLFHYRVPARVLELRVQQDGADEDLRHYHADRAGDQPVRLAVDQLVGVRVGRLTGSAQSVVYAPGRAEHHLLDAQLRDQVRHAAEGRVHRFEDHGIAVQFERRSSECAIAAERSRDGWDGPIAECVSRRRVRHGTANATTDATGTVNLAFTGAAAAASCVSDGVGVGIWLRRIRTRSRSWRTAIWAAPAADNTFGTTGAGGLALNGTRLPNVTYRERIRRRHAGNVPYVVSPTCPVGVTGTCTNFTYDPLDQGTRMAFAFHWVWPLEAIPPLGIQAIPLTGQLFLNGSTTPLNLDVCPEIIPAYGVGGTFTGLAVGSPSPIDQESPTPVGTQAGCLVRRTVQQVGNQIQLIEDAYVQGDYAARRN